MSRTAQCRLSGGRSSWTGKPRKRISVRIDTRRLTGHQIREQPCRPGGHRPPEMPVARINPKILNWSRTNDRHPVGRRGAQSTPRLSYRTAEVGARKDVPEKRQEIANARVRKREVVAGKLRRAGDANATLDGDHDRMEVVVRYRNAQRWVLSMAVERNRVPFSGPY